MRSGLILFLGVICNFNLYAQNLVLEKIIEKITNSQKNDYQISREENEEVFNLYLDLGKQLAEKNKEAKAPFEEHYQEFETLGLLFFKLAKPLIKDFEEKVIFEMDIKKAVSKKRCSYRWFITFIDALSVAISDNKTRATSGFYLYHNNTYFDVYRGEFIQQCSNHIDPKDYRTKHMGNKITNTLGTSLGFAKLFPKVIVLPYPFALSDTQIALSLPCPQNPTFLEGFNLSTKRPLQNADSQELDAGEFLGHDGLHLSIYLANLMVLFCVDHQKLHDKEALKSKVKELVKARKIFFALLERAQHVIKNGEIVDETEKRCFEFFTFLVFHEYRKGLLNRLQLFTGQNKFDFTQKFFSDESYYGALLPQKWRNLEKKALANLLEGYFKKFLEKLFEDEHIVLKNEIEERFGTANKGYKIVTNLLFDPSIYRHKYMCELQEHEHDIPCFVRPIKAVLDFDVLKTTEVSRLVVTDPMGDEPEIDFIERLIKIEKLNENEFYKMFGGRKITNDNTLLMLAAAFAEPQVVLNRAQQNPEEINQKNCHGETPILWACHYNRLDNFEILASMGADLSIRDTSKRTPLDIFLAKAIKKSKGFEDIKKCLYLLHGRPKKEIYYFVVSLYTCLYTDYYPDFCNLLNYIIESPTLVDKSSKCMISFDENHPDLFKIFQEKFDAEYLEGVNKFHICFLSDEE